MITLLLILLPIFVGGLSLVMKGKNTILLALLAAIAELGITIYALLNFDPIGGFQFVWDYWWIPDLGMAWSFGIDGISMVMILLTNILVPLIILSQKDRKIESRNALLGLTLIMQGALIGVFTSLDVIVFYVFWELALIPVYFIAGLWGGKERIATTLKFFIYTVFGSLLMLVAFLYLLTHGGIFNQLDGIPILTIQHRAEMAVFWGIFIAFAIKIPIFPFHSWQPETYTQSSTTGTMLLSGIMLKMGLYAILRWLIPIVPNASAFYAKLIIILGIIGIVYASIIAIKQNNIKRLLAFSSMAHVGLIAVAFFTGSITGWQGGVFQMFTHGINVVALFLVADILIEKTGVTDIRKMGGIASKAPKLAILFFMLILGSVALPLTDSFVGEFLMLSGLFNWNMWAMIIAGTSVIFSAVYLFRLYQKTMFGVVSEHTKDITDISWNELTVLSICCGIMLFLGIFPNALMQISNPTLEKLLSSISRF